MWKKPISKIAEKKTNFDKRREKKFILVHVMKEKAISVNAVKEKKNLFLLLISSAQLNCDEKIEWTFIARMHYNNIKFIIISLYRRINSPNLIIRRIILNSLLILRSLTN